MTIWADRSRSSIVCGCQRCPQLRELANTPAEADAWVRHHAQLHADDDADAARRAVTAARARERRRDTPST